MSTATLTPDTHNPYETPKADLIERRTKEGALPLFVVSTNKLLLMYILTAGLYGVVWYYQHYRAIKQSTGESLWPVARAIFVVFFTHNLFKRIHNEATAQQVNVGWNHSMLATVLVGIYLISYVAGEISPWLYLASLALYIVMAAILVKVQKTANAIQNDEHGSHNSRITLLNVFWIIVGLFLWLGLVTQALFLSGVITL